MDVEAGASGAASDAAAAARSAEPGRGMRGAWTHTAGSGGNSVGQEWVSSWSGVGQYFMDPALHHRGCWEMRTTSLAQLRIRRPIITGAVKAQGCLLSSMPEV